MEALEYHGSWFLFPMTYFSFPWVLFPQLVFDFHDLFFISIS